MLLGEEDFDIVVLMGGVVLEVFVVVLVFVVLLFGLMCEVFFIEFVYVCSGDKGDIFNIGVIVCWFEDLLLLCV